MSSYAIHRMYIVKWLLRHSYILFLIISLTAQSWPLLPNEGNASLPVAAEHGGDGAVLFECTPTTPIRPNDNPCGFPVDWAMALFGLPEAHRYYTVDYGTFTQYEDSTIMVQVKFTNATNPLNGFDAVIEFIDGMEWNQWSTQDFMASFKADCGNEDAEYTSWKYYVMNNSNTSLTGFGAYSGSSLTMSHAPPNKYFGFQMGTGANNYNSVYGFGGWFHVAGTLKINSQVNNTFNSAGDLAFELDCCPVPSFSVGSDGLTCSNPELEHQWYLNGEELAGESNCSLELTTGGIYELGLSASSGCTTMSEPYVHCPAATLSFDEGSEVLSADPGYASYQWWYNDEVLAEEISFTIQSPAPGEYYVVLSTEYGCVLFSDTLTVEVNCETCCAIPSFTVNGNNFVCEQTDSEEYAWYVNGEALSGASDCSLIAESSGIYELEITFPYGCVKRSDAFLYCEPLMPQYLTDEDLLSVSEGYTTYTWFINGAEIPDEQGHIIPSPPSGDYYVIATTDFGCITQSETVSVIRNNINHVGIQPYQVFPIPARDELIVTGAFGQGLKIYDLTGKQVLADPRKVFPGVVDVSALSPGKYFIETTSQAGFPIRISFLKY